MVKYKVHEAAKDFNVKSNVIVDLLAKFSDTPRKSQTALEEWELDILFDYFTQQHSVENFDAYFAMKKPVEAKPEPVAEEKTEAPAAEAGSFVPDNPNAIPGLTVHSVTVEETPLGWTVRFISSITDDVAFENFKRMDCDELTDFDGGGFVLEDDGTWSTT